MTMADDYISRVINRMPRATPLRSQISLELRGLIAERLERGQSIDDVVRQLGDPVALAESYLAAVPLVSAPFWRRAAAKGIDALTVGAIGGALWAGAIGILGDLYQWWIVLGFAAIAVALLLPVYTVVAEYWFGFTLGKRALDLRVVRESGARISFLQSIVRQLPNIGQIFLIDALFALFTEKNQRAFELASKTRVVLIGTEVRPDVHD